MINKYAVALVYVFYYIGIFLALSISFMPQYANKPVNPTLISGLITADCVLIGFVFTAVINKSELFELGIWFPFLIYVTIFTFFTAILVVFLSAITSEATIFALCWILSSIWTSVIIFCVVFAVLLFQRQVTKSRNLIFARN